jgi:hypothetical protein
MDEAMFSQAVPSLSGQRGILQVSLSLMTRAGIPNVICLDLRIRVAIKLERRES